MSEKGEIRHTSSKHTIIKVIKDGPELLVGEVNDRILELSGLLKQGQRRADNMAGTIKMVRVTLARREEELAAITDEYNQNRQALLFEELKRQGLTWCTCCMKLVLKVAIRFIFVEGRGEFSKCYDKYIDEFLCFSHLERVCPSCKQNAFHMDGWKNDYEHGWVGGYREGQAFFRAYLVEKREDGFYYRQINSSIPWRWLDKEKCQLPELTDVDIDNFCAQLGLPRRLTKKGTEPGPEKSLFRDTSVRCQLPVSLKQTDKPGRGYSKPHPYFA